MRSAMVFMKILQTTVTEKVYARTSDQFVCYLLLPLLFFCFLLLSLFKTLTLELKLCTEPSDLTKCARNMNFGLMQFPSIFIWNQWLPQVVFKNFSFNLKHGCQLWPFFPSRFPTSAWANPMRLVTYVHNSLRKSYLLYLKQVELLYHVLLWSACLVSSCLREI